MNTESYPSNCRLARYAARFSFIAPFVAYIIYVTIQHSQALSEAQAGLLRIIDLGLDICVLLLPVFGFISGIAALIATKRHGREGIFGWAFAGVLVCGLFLSLVVLIVFAVQHHYARHTA